VRGALDRWFAAPAPFLTARWLWLRSLGLIFLSVFYSLWFQIHGLIGPTGILPARDYLLYAKQAVGDRAYWFIPSLLWIDASHAALTTLVVAGLIASITLTFNFFPRTSIAIAGLCHLSFAAAAQDFSGYQSAGMLLEAALLSLFVAGKEPPTRAAVFLLQWEWFRIYFESGVVKILSGEEQWRHLTAMDKYYENGPLPTRFAWSVQQWPHSFHATTAAITLIAELLLVWLLFVPSRRVRLALFALTTALQIGIILTANYAFLNYLVLALGFFLIHDREVVPINDRSVASIERPIRRAEVVVLPAIFILSIVIFFARGSLPARFIDPFRIVNNYGLFAVMTRERYEIEFQGTSDGRLWIAYPFRYKPQIPTRPPRFFAPYQPRFDWNLWFASLGTASQNPWVMATQERLLANDRDVLRLFAANPFPHAPPRAVRVMLWQYWFTTRQERARSGAWWNRRLIGEYAPVAVR
jgi:hypothetical protein